MNLKSNRPDFFQGDAEEFGGILVGLLGFNLLFEL